MKNNKYFIITVDTEGDNLWSYIPGTEVETKNAAYIPHFQKICDKYEFKPVYLANFEMLNSKQFVDFAKITEKEGRCEIGLHLHAWNNPPYYELEHSYSGNPYLIEYPYEVMKNKFEVLFNLYVNIFGHYPISHRAGRWAMNKQYFRILELYGIQVDCSYTPGINWQSDCGQTVPNGPDYSKEKLGVSKIGNVLEVPVTLKKFHFVTGGSFKYRIRCLLKGQDVWLRTSICSVSDIKKLINTIHKKDDVNFIEFMIHSSELMPDGSPYFKTEESVLEHLEKINSVFSYAYSLGYIGVTLADYRQIIEE